MKKDETEMLNSSLSATGGTTCPVYFSAGGYTPGVKEDGFSKRNIRSIKKE
ncbi:MAG: hypothetical protein JXA44_01975 [Methanospirillaceae archaeon]|nr:hypothetical protein [Methanospirillaceae archaeon]